MILNKIYDVVCYKIKLVMFKIKWRKHNVHNFTTTNCLFPIDLVNVGKYSYGPINIYNYGEENSGLSIGNLCSIALDVKFILGGNHFSDKLFSYPIGNMLLNGGIESYSKGKIVIGHDCWIGVGSIILSGVELGNGCIVAAGSVVTKSFSPYSIIGGAPAKLIRMRFSDNIISELNKCPFVFDLSIERYKTLHANFDKQITDTNVVEVLNAFKAI